MGTKRFYKIPPITKEWLIEAYKTRQLEDIAKEFNVCKTTIRKWAIKLGIPGRERWEYKAGKTTKYKLLDDKKWLEEEYWEKDLSTIEIAKKVGCTKGAVGFALYKHKIRTRTYCESVKIRDSKNPRKGPNATNWKGGRLIRSGYILVYSPNHPARVAKQYAYEHRLIMEKHLGRYLKRTERVHHIDGNKLNNKIENLLLYDNQKEHRKTHRNLLIENIILKREIKVLKDKISLYEK